MNADRVAHKIVKLRKGAEKRTIVEQGTHDELVASKGQYFRLVAA